MANRNAWEENRAQRVRSPKPCIFCGEESRHVNQVCRDCYGIYCGNKRDFAAEEVLGRPAVAVAVQQNLGYYLRPSYANPSESELGGLFDRAENIGKPLVEILLDLAGAIRTSDENRERLNDFNIGSHAFKVGIEKGSNKYYAEYYVVDGSVAEKINEALRLITNLTLFFFEDGKSSGASLLGRIISGELTVDETNEKLR